MKFHLPLGFLKALMAVVCVPGVTIAADAVQNAYTQSPISISYGVAQVGNSAFAVSAPPVTLYWDSTSGESAVWDTVTTTTWVNVQDEETACEAGAQVEFGEGTDLNKSVQITPEGVSASVVEITGSGYQFSGGDMVVTDRVSAEQSAEIVRVLVIGSATNPLEIQVAAGEKLTTSVLETSFTGSHEHHVYEHGSFVKNGAGTLSVTDAVHGSITGVTVNEGALELGSVVSLNVGANEIKGGTLENVEMLITGEINRAVSGDVAIAHNVIKSADGNNAAVLTDVTLHAGTSTEYATLQNVSFAGNSILRGYITFEETQRQRDMSVAAGGTLTVDNVCFDLHGLAGGDKVLIDNAAGTLLGWDTAKFVYSGITVNSAAVNSSVAGVVTINREHSGNLYWNGAEDAKWNSASANWSSQPDGTGSEAFTALSNVSFGSDAANRVIAVSQDLVVMNLSISDGGYSFSGGRIATLGDASINTGAGNVTFHNQLVVQGNMTVSGKGALELLSATTVVQDMTLETNNITIDGDVTVLGNFVVNAGDADTAGRVDIYGNVTADEMNISVSAGAKAGVAYKDELVHVTGNLSVGESGFITIGGTAEQHYLGVVTAGELTINTQEHEVYFDHLHVGSLTVDKGAHVHVQTASASVTLSTSSFPVINLAGTLALDAHGATYDRGYTVRLQDDAAQLKFGTGTTIDNMSIIGQADGSGYTNLTMSVQARNATVTQMRDLGNLTIKQGSLTVTDATGAVHGTLNLDNAKLKLADGVNDIMAAGSGTLQLTNGARLDLGNTSQSLTARNSISLSGASAINGSNQAAGLLLADNMRISYADSGNTISANMTAQGNMFFQSEVPDSVLNITGKLSGSGLVELTGPGTVAFSGENAFNGVILVEQQSTLSLQSTHTLAQAGVYLGNGATLALDAPGTAQLNALTLMDGASINISSIVGTDKASAQNAALSVTPGNAALAYNNVTLNVAFADKLETLTTYNILTGLTSADHLSINVSHNGTALDSSQYKVGFDSEDGVLYIQTLMGNVWEGKSASAMYYGYGIWSNTNRQGNWSHASNYDEAAEYNDAIFSDLNGGSSTVQIQGTVTPGDVYFVADETKYKLTSSWDGYLAAGTNIHKDGKADVTLSIYNNVDAAHAIGNFDIQAGRVIMDESLAVQGVVTVADDARLELIYNETFNAPSTLLMSPNADGNFQYIIRGIQYSTFSEGHDYQNATLTGLTLDDDGIRGSSADAYGFIDKAQINGDIDLTYLTLQDSAVTGGTLSHVTVASSNAVDDKVRGYFQLNNVTIGENVVIAENSSISLVEYIVFKNTLINKGVIHIANVTAEIGKVNYTFTVDENGRSEYVYQFISMQDGGRFDILSYQSFLKEHVEINGINLENGLATGVAASFVDNGNGSFTLSVGNIQGYDENGKVIVDGTVGMPQWDERWGKDANAPGISRRYAGTDSTVDFYMAAGDGNSANYFMYDSIVNSDNDEKVNGGDGAIVVTLSSIATGNLASAGTWGAAAADHEVWIYDRSGFKTVIGGLANWVEAPQSAATHILVNVDPLQHNVAKNIIGGSYRMDQKAESFVTVQNGNINLLVGGSSEWGYSQTGTAHVFIDGGTIGEIFAAGYDTNLIGTQIVDGRKRAVEMVLTGGTLGNLQDNGTKRVFGGGHGYTINGDIYIRMEGNANVTTQLVGGSNGGTVEGDIVLDLISGAANRVDAAGLGWGDEWNQTYSYTNGNILVNLYSSFNLGSLVDSNGTDYKGGALYGGKENGTSYVKVGDGYTSTLNFAEAGVYELGSIAADGYSSSPDSVTVTGFDRITLAEGAHAIVALGMFDNNMDTNAALEISGQGIIEVIGHGANFGRDIQLQDGATLKISTSWIGNALTTDDDRTITVTDGSTIDFSGFPVDAKFEEVHTYAGLGFNAIICGNGVDGRGAIYKGQDSGNFYPTGDIGNKNIVNRISLPQVTLTGNASARVEQNEYLFMNSNELADTRLDLDGYTFTKLGAGEFIARSVTITPGTILVQGGSFGTDLNCSAELTDIVLAANTALKLDSTDLTEDTVLGIRALSGSGDVMMNSGELTLHTTSRDRYYTNYLDEAQSYNQFMSSTGFAYAVYSGAISDDKTWKSVLIKAGDGVHYLSGSDSTYTGGTRLLEGRLYLLGSGTVSDFSKGETTAAAGVVGSGSIIWNSSAVELYLGHNARIYNSGTTNQENGVMTIGVEGAPEGTLADFIGIHSQGANGELTYVTMGGVEYVEIATHNLKSIAVDAMYANGTAYVAGSEINRNLMLLVRKSDWAAAQSTAVTGFSDTGYNEAVYSGVLCDTDDVAARLRKEGVGTLVLDQTNTYSGGTEIAGGTLRVRGWGTLGDNVKDNVVEMTQAGATLMFTYNTGYGDEPTEITNDISLIGSGDARWLGHAATDGDTAALISAIGPASTLTLSGDISGSGNVRHSGEGVLVLSGDSLYTGGTYVSRGTLEVQSAAGLGATASGQGSVTVEHDADLRVTVEEGFTGERMVTTLAADENDIQGNVVISGTTDTERILHMDGNGYNAYSTTLNENGTLLINGAAINGEAVKAESELLTGNGRIVVSDVSGSGASATFDTMIDYTGDFRVEGDNASITVNNGTFIDGNIHVAGRQASVSTGSDVFITDGNSLVLRSTGDAAQNSAAMLNTDGVVSIEAGAVFSVHNEAADHEYNLSLLVNSASYAMMETVQITLQSDIQPENVAYHQLGTGAGTYDGRFDASIASNLQAVGVVNANGGLTLTGGSTYETANGHTNLMGATLTLDTMENSLLTFFSIPDATFDANIGKQQLVLFSGVNGVYFGYDKVTASHGSGIYYTLASRYLTGWDFIDDYTLLVYDAIADIVYLQQQAVPEPTTATLSLLALAALAARRRRK